MVDIPLKDQTENLIICIIFDLSKLETIEDLGNRAQKLIQKLEQSGNKNKIEVILIANKFDKFSSKPNNEKLIVNNYLRSLALIFNGKLIQCSNNSESQMLKVKKLISQFIFKTRSGLTNEADVNKALVIMKDSWESIGIRSLDSASMELTKSIVQNRIRSGNTKYEPPNSQKFLEPVIDAAVDQYKTYSTFKPLIKT